RVLDVLRDLRQRHRVPVLLEEGAEWLGGVGVRHRRRVGGELLVRVRDLRALVDDEEGCDRTDDAEEEECDEPAENPQRPVLLAPKRQNGLSTSFTHSAILDDLAEVIAPQTTMDVVTGPNPLRMLTIQNRTGENG